MIKATPSLLWPRTRPSALKKARRHCALSVTAVTLAFGAQAQDRAQHLPTTHIVAGMYNLKVEVAQTPEEQEIGLMFRTSMPANEGMLFAFERPSRQCFWMKNTLIPLAVAFIADDGSVVNTDEMQPQTLNPHCSTKPVRFVLEMNAGWFAKHGIKDGFKFGGAPFGAGPAQ